MAVTVTVLITSIMLSIAVKASPIELDMNNYTNKIYGGAEAYSKYEFPHQISLQYDDNHICGGSIIGPSEILTAAHCVDKNKYLSRLEVKAGSSSRRAIEATTQFRKVAKIIAHPDYHYAVKPDKSPINDIAILKLASPLEFTDAVKPISLPATAGLVFPPGYEATAIGWGLTSEGGQGSENLMKIEMTIFSQQQCTWTFGSYITDAVICALGKNRSTVCKGDSGGALLSTWTPVKTLIGLSSFGSDCSGRGVPTAFTKVAPFRSWIKENAGI